MLKPTRITTLLSCFMLLSSFHLVQAQTPATAEAPSSTPETPETQGTQEPPETPAETRKATVVNAQYQQQALSDEQQAQEIVWLEPTYPDQKEPARVLALAQKHRTVQAQGAVLIVPDQGQHPDWPSQVSPLRQSLPDFGWYTLSISMPNPSPGTIPSRQLGAKAQDSVDLNAQIQSAIHAGARAQKPDAASSPAEPATPAAPADPATTAATTNQTVTDPVDIDLQSKTASTVQPGSYSAWAQANLEAGMAHLQAQGYQNIVLIALGKNAEAALAWLKPKAQQMSKGGFALILIDPSFTNVGQSFWQDQLGAGFAAPVLDIVNSSDLDSRRQTELRRTGADAAGMQGYQQARLQTAGDGVAQKNLVRRIQQWMGIHAPDMAATQFKR